MEGSQIYGRGYESGDYDMYPNGSLIINGVKLSNKFNYTVLFDPHPAGANEFIVVPVKVYGGSCQENIYLEVGKQGVVSCHFENCDIIGWIYGSGDVTSTSPFIYKEGSKMYGQGYRNGDYGMHPNGSLIINEVKLSNEFNYTVLFVPHPTGANNYFEVPVKVYVPPEPGYPVVNGRAKKSSYIEIQVVSSTVP
ncbi:uncharacterized protein [Apostichopus japonicus]|uniref:uncharacterized protein n=1 Tax=Stichopus japonicus TaxID=307972 RepID=UPI003AB3285B